MTFFSEHSVICSIRFEIYALFEKYVQAQLNIDALFKLQCQKLNRVLSLKTESTHA